ncbi:MAG TPA: gas vesicle protein [Actinomycetes bacterium]|nr:gas vesicle protein [Actinomycetes bacterium]
MTVQSSPPVQGALRSQPSSLADVLERVLDKGIVIAGDVVVNVLDLELLTLRLRLFVSSADTARELGMDWWTTDPFFSSVAARDERRELRDRVAQLEALLQQHGIEAAPEGPDRPETDATAETGHADR